MYPVILFLYITRQGLFTSEHTPEYRSGGFIVVVTCPGHLSYPLYTVFVQYTLKNLGRKFPTVFAVGVKRC